MSARLDVEMEFEEEQKHVMMGLQILSDVIALALAL